MNCQEVNFILDSRQKSELDADANRTIEEHLTSCEKCRDAWSAFDAIAARRVPETPHGLASRMAAEFSAQAPEQSRRIRRSTVLGGALIVGAAVAASIALRTDDTTLDISDGANEARPVVTSEPPQEPTESQVADSLAVSPADSDDPNNPDSVDVEIDGEETSGVSLDPYSVTVIVTPNVAAEPDAIAFFEECHEYVLADLNKIAGLNVIAGDRVAAYESLNLDAADIARALGAGVFVELYMPSELASCQVLVVDTTTGELLEGFGGVYPPDYSLDRLRSIAADFARRVEDSILRDPDTASAEALVSFFNTALDDNVRVRAVLSLRTGTEPTTPLSGVMDESIKAVLTQIAMTSSDATARANALYALRGTADHDLIEPLLHALANDADEGVRRGAAYALHFLVDEPIVRRALERARNEDPSAQRGERCCIQTVREAAQRSLLSDEAVIESTIETFMSDSLGPLTDRERIRLLMTSPDGRAMFPFPLPDDAAHAVYEMGVRSTADSDLRRTAWTMLGWTSLGPARLVSESAQTLANDLVTHPNEDVQRAAAYALTQHIDDPEVREVVQHALSEDLSEELRQILISGLQGGAP